MIEMDPKPLVPLYTPKQLDNLPPRVLPFHFQMDRFTYILHHIPGKDLHTADTLSRAPLMSIVNDKDLEELAEHLMVANISYLPAGEKRLEQYRQAQKDDPTCSTLQQYCRMAGLTKIPSFLTSGHIGKKGETTQSVKTCCYI